MRTLSAASSLSAAAAWINLVWAFVLSLTDVSPNRKTRLEREIRVSSSLEQIEADWPEWQEEQFVKGWVVR